MAAFDPVCNMTVEEDEAAATADYDGKTYYFCSAACRKISKKTQRHVCAKSNAAPLRIYLAANTSSAILAAASSCNAGMACE